MSFAGEEWPYDLQQYDDDDDSNSTTPISRQSSASLSAPRALGPASSSHAWRHTRWFEHEDTQGVLSPPSHSLSSPSAYEDHGEQPSSHFDIFEDYFSSSDGGMDDSDYVSSSSSLSSPPMAIPIAQVKPQPNQRKPLTALVSNTLLASPSQPRLIPSAHSTQRRYSEAEEGALFSFPSATPYEWAASLPKQPVTAPSPPPPSFIPPSSFVNTTVAFPELPTLLHPDHKETENEALSYKPRAKGFLLGKLRPKGW